MKQRHLVIAAAAAIAGAALFLRRSRHPKLHLPQGRHAYRCDEPILLAVSAAPRELRLELRSSHTSTVSIPLRGDNSTLLLRLAPGALAPSDYTVYLNGRPAGHLWVVRGLSNSGLLLSQCPDPPGLPGPSANMAVVHANHFGKIDGHGRPRRDTMPSQGMRLLEEAVARDLPTIVYTVWTGHVTHRPFGHTASWASASSRSAQRQSSLHAAQRLRRFGRSLHSLGVLDEPRINDPAWDEAEWYEALGGPGPEARVETLRRLLSTARDDLRSVWPEAPFLTDLYAPEQLHRGCDPTLQDVNDQVCTHIFCSPAWGRAGLMAGLAVARAARPNEKVAHACNGQLHGEPADRSSLRNAFLLSRNLLLAGGLYSNWWLNTGCLEEPDFAWLNQPALRLGGLFQVMQPAPSDLAILWSVTELRARLEACPDARRGSRTQTYERAVTGLAQALQRCGHNPEVIHEARFDARRYKVVALVGHSAPLEATLQASLKEFVERGGALLADKVSQPHAPHTVAILPDFEQPFQALEDGLSPRLASYLRTDHCLDEPVRRHVDALKEILANLPIQPLWQSDSLDLIGARRLRWSLSHDAAQRA